MKTIILAAAATLFTTLAGPAQTCTNGTYLGRLSVNPYAADSTSNTFGRFGSADSATSIHNAYGTYGSAYSPASVANPCATAAPKIIAADGTYLGRLSANRFDPESVSNPFGQYGSPYSATSIRNPYSTYGSKFSPISPTNPFATQAPVLCGED